MGLNNEHALTTERPWVVFDIETAPLPNAAEFIDPPDLSEISAPSNYKNAEAIADYVARERERLTAKHQRACQEKAALDWNVGRIVAIGAQTEADTRPTVLTCNMEPGEALALTWLWERICSRRPVVGFNIRSFDVPFCIQRSRFLKVAPERLSLARFDNHDLCDLADLLTFSDTQTTKVMSHSLAAFAKRFGIRHDETVSGADIPALVANGDWRAIEAHCRADVETTVALAARLGVIRPRVREAVA